MHTTAETEQLVCISIKKVKNTGQADEKLVSLSVDNNLGSSKEIRACTGTREGENGGQKVPLASHFLSFHSGFSLLETSEQ